MHHCELVEFNLKGFHSYRGLLTLYAGAVEPQSRDTVCGALDVKDTLVVPLSRLRLRQVLSQ